MTKTRLISGCVTACVTVFLWSCTHTSRQASLPPGSLYFMTYNVENFFDTEVNSAEDHTYLPKNLKGSLSHQAQCSSLSPRYRDECLQKDWNEKVLQTKISRLADVIRQVNNGRGPDILTVAEVENIQVLRKLFQEELKDLGYQTVTLLEGFDRRGIDVGIVSRLKQDGEAQLHRIPFDSPDPKEKERMQSSRGILQTTLILPDGEKVTVFAVHFPAQANPRPFRIQAIDFLNKLKADLPSDRLALAGGDFNVSKKEDMEAGLYREKLNGPWLVSHILGCKSCVGTHYWGGDREWSFLDALLFSPHFSQPNSKWQVIPESINVVSGSRYQTNRFGTPARFDENSPVGVSDHFGLIGVIAPRAQ